MKPPPSARKKKRDDFKDDVAEYMKRSYVECKLNEGKKGREGWERDGLGDRREVVMVKRQVSKMEGKKEEVEEK